MNRHVAAALSLALVTSTAFACGDGADSPPPATVTVETGGDAPAGGKGDSFEAAEDRWEQIRERCTPPDEDEEVVYSNDFRWGYTLEEMGEKFDEMYASGKRLHNRAYYDAEADRFVLPGTESWGGDVTLPTRLVENVTLHIEHGLERGYVDYVFFPDMGHAHLFIPIERWEEVYEGTPVSEFSRRYEAMFDDPELMILYHTAEQLQMLDDDDRVLDDRRVQWRFHTRNLVGDNNYERRIELLTEFESNANTAHDLPGHNYYGAGFNITATADGCFPFEQDGELRWYDISLNDLPYDTSGGGTDWGL